MKKYAIIFFFYLPLLGIQAQEEALVDNSRPDFTLSLNAVGDLALFSLGFEKLFFIKPGTIIAGKMGLGFNTEFDISDNPSDTYFVLPHHVSVNFGRKKSFLELGIGASLITISQYTGYFIYPIAGYRFHPFKNPGFSFRAWLYYPFGQTSGLEDLNILLVPYGLSFAIAI